jgi:hypothetical protein
MSGSNRALTAHFQTAGLPAVFDPRLTYECTPNSSGVSGQLYVTAAGEELPIFSSAPRPTRCQIPDRASWRIGGSPVMAAR